LASDASKTEAEGQNPSDDASADTDANTPSTEEIKADAEDNNQSALNNADADKPSATTVHTARTGEVSNQNVLTPLQLRVENRGKRTICHVSKTIIPEGGTIVITYQSTAQKDLARGNFEQVNALSYGGKRYIVEG
jgi:hypothetical protein